MIKYSFNLLSLQEKLYLVSDDDFRGTGNPFEATKVFDCNATKSQEQLKAAKENGFPEAKFVTISVAYSVKDV